MACGRATLSRSAVFLVETLTFQFQFRPVPLSLAFFFCFRLCGGARGGLGLPSSFDFVQCINSVECVLCYTFSFGGACFCRCGPGALPALLMVSIASFAILTYLTVECILGGVLCRHG